MIIAIIFLVIFAACFGVNIYFLVNLVKSPMIEIDYKKFFKKNGLIALCAVFSFVVASFGFYMWLNASYDFIHTFQLVVGAIIFSDGLLVAINCFTIHYYGKNIPEQLDKWLFRIQLISYVASLVFFFIWTNGLAPYLTYPLVNGLNFKQGFVTPESLESPNLAFYAICIIGGAGLVYFVCDHYMYKEYGKHGILESTFFVAFPAGILGARIWYVVGNWAKEFDYGRAMSYIGDVKIWAPLAIWNGGLTILGGAIMGIVVGVAWFLWRNKGKSIWFAVDMIVPTILIAQAVGRWGNFFNCEVHGLLVNTDYFKWLPEIIWRNGQYSSTSGWAPDGQMYVPLFFIEYVSNLFGYFLIAHVFGRALGKYHEPGDLCFAYVIWYGLTRVLMEPLRSTDYQMGNNGYWSWVWSMIFVLAGTLLIVINHLVRYFIKKKKNIYVVQPYDKKLGLIATCIIAIVGGGLLALGIYLMSANNFLEKVEYNGFNMGLMLLILGASIILTIAISLQILFSSLNKEKEAF